MSDSITSNEWDGDVLNRKKYSVFLTNYLKNKNEAYVININAPWGTGKTFFLKKWYADIEKNHPAVYFNAWENDYSNDPLVSIISTIKQKIIPLLPKDVQQTHAAKIFLTNSGKMLKKLTPILIKGAMSKAIGTEGVQNLFDVSSEDDDTLSDLSSKFAEELLSSHETISNSIGAFKNSIDLLVTEVTSTGVLNPPLFVFIDELDRCRPLYSIELLERIKHIFNIPCVVFIVATDTEQLSHSVKAIYGEGFNGEIYLRRFFDQIFTLPEPNCIEFTTLLFKEFIPNAKYFDYYVNSQGNSVNKNEYTLTSKVIDNVELILLFTLFAKFFKLDLRSKKQCFDRFVAIEKSLTDKEDLHFGYLIFLIMLDAKHPNKFNKYFTCNNIAQRNQLIVDFEDTFDNLTIYREQITAKNIIDKYTRIVFLTGKEIRAFEQNLKIDDDFDSVLFLSLYKNHKSIIKYKERVEMVETLNSF